MIGCHLVTLQGAEGVLQGPPIYVQAIVTGKFVSKQTPAAGVGVGVLAGLCGFVHLVSWITQGTCLQGQLCGSNVCHCVKICK